MVWSDWMHLSFPNTNVFKDMNNGTLPSVSWVIPSLEDSDHPASGCSDGPRWVIQSLTRSARANTGTSTAIILVWDDWGGWYDPVPPPQTNYTSLGFRVGMVAISPWARPDTVAHTQYDFGSILKFIEQTFGLGSLHTTDETATSMATCSTSRRSRRSLCRRSRCRPRRLAPVTPTRNGSSNTTEVYQNSLRLSEGYRERLSPPSDLRCSRGRRGLQQLHQRRAVADKRAQADPARHHYDAGEPQLQHDLRGLPRR